MQCRIDAPGQRDDHQHPAIGLHWSNVLGRCSTLGVTPVCEILAAPSTWSGAPADANGIPVETGPGTDHFIGVQVIGRAILRMGMFEFPRKIRKVAVTIGKVVNRLAAIPRQVLRSAIPTGRSEPCEILTGELTLASLLSSQKWTRRAPFELHLRAPLLSPIGRQIADVIHQTQCREFFFDVVR